MVFKIKTDCDDLTFKVFIYLFKYNLELYLWDGLECLDTVEE